MRQPSKRRRMVGAPCAVRYFVVSETRPGVYRVPSDHDPSVSYEVDLNGGRCNCPAFLYSGGLGCKHLARMGEAVRRIGGAR